ncbi:acetolactate synthase large subunit [Herbaspirillum lusitanum]|uniref:Acetolactate synthase large subunit n=1 Tax=Herbaspirillum lusitanum TaxID=213312 RepID=A0ABW9ABR3_9BURK
MNGAESLVKTLVAGGVDTCFANPGTSEMHFVAALDKVPGVRCVLCLFEGVATGAADGYARMADKPAATLLHLGPGLGNGLANLHNARRAHTPIVNIVGDHATYHLQYDSPLTSDVEGIARPMSAWVRTSRDARSVGADAAEAITVANSPKGQIATLILPANTAWSNGGVVSKVAPADAPKPVPEEVVREVAQALASGSAMLLLGNRALRSKPMALAAAIGAKTGCLVRVISRNPRIQRGAGRVALERIANPIEKSAELFRSVQTMILVDEDEPVAFFAHPGKVGKLTAPDSNILTLAMRGDDVVAALESLADLVGARVDEVPLEQFARPDIPTGELTLEKIGQALGALLPEHAIVCDESITSGRTFFPSTRGAPQHDWLQLTGGSIGIGMPMATGAAVACPDRKVINLQADGSGMYTLQALWTQAREQLNVLTVIWANRSYKILHNEFANVGAGKPGERASSMLDLDNPSIDWVSLAKGMGVEGRRVETMEQFAAAMKAGLAVKGPFLIEVTL